MVLSQHQRTIGVFSSRKEAGQALNHLKDSGFPMAQVSLIAKDSAPNQQLDDDEVMRNLANKARQGATTGSVQGLVKGNKLGSVAGLLLGVSTLAIPGVGQVILAGSAGTVIAFAFSSGAIGAASGGLIGGLIGLAATEAQVKSYGESVLRGNYLVMVQGSDEEIYRAESIISAR